MKTFYFNLQAKGGVGKSTLTYLQALKREENFDCAFVDLDSCNKSSSKQLLFLKPDDVTDTQQKKRFFAVDIYDQLKKIEREKMMDIIQAFGKMDYREIFMDFGSSESEQFPALFSLDFSVDEFKEFERYVDAKFVFNIIVAGGTLYAPCFDYVKSLIKIINKNFDVVICINDMTFAQSQSGRLLKEIMEFVLKQNKNIQLMRFGDFQLDRNSGQLITENIRTGGGMSGLASFAAKTIMKRELAKL